MHIYSEFDECAGAVIRFLSLPPSPTRTRAQALHAHAEAGAYCPGDADPAPTLARGRRQPTKPGRRHSAGPTRQARPQLLLARADGRLPPPPLRLSGMLAGKYVKVCKTPGSGDCRVVYRPVLTFL